jgi:hypothetical protein
VGRFHNDGIFHVICSSESSFDNFHPAKLQFLFFTWNALFTLCLIHAKTFEFRGPLRRPLPLYPLFYGRYKRYTGNDLPPRKYIGQHLFFSSEPQLPPLLTVLLPLNQRSPLLLLRCGLYSRLPEWWWVGVVIECPLESRDT